MENETWNQFHRKYDRLDIYHRTNSQRFIEGMTVVYLFYGEQRSCVGWKNVFVHRMKSNQTHCVCTFWRKIKFVWLFFLSHIINKLVHFISFIFLVQFQKVIVCKKECSWYAVTAIDIFSIGRGEKFSTNLWSKKFPHALRTNWQM